MAIWKCKMCGATLQVPEGATVAQCTYCDTMQTLPRLDDDRHRQLYERANRLRCDNEYDKAAKLFEQLVNEDPNDAESYWSLVLCKYGVEYVEDPRTHRRTPTVNRAQFTSVLADGDYKAALQHGDTAQRSIYMRDAKLIDEIQKGILSISQKEKPFDVFICYKETDQSGRRTPDSVLAGDLYQQLKQAGFNVFFARVTLEDKLGREYEPYIFAALQSAKVMVALGTRPEHFQAVWVKNEWSRYLALIREGADKTLIPAYRDMNPYDLPEEFSHLQAQDMSRLGFMQDLIRGIEKIVHGEADPAKSEVVVGAVNTESLLRRVALFLEDGDFRNANLYCEKVLDADAECAKAYLGKLLCEARVKTPEELATSTRPFSQSGNFQKAVRFGDEAMKQLLVSAAEANLDYQEDLKKQRVCDRARHLIENGRHEGHYKKALEALEEVRGWPPAEELVMAAQKKIGDQYRDADYRRAEVWLGLHYRDAEQERRQIGDALQIFTALHGYRDADEKAAQCRQRLAQIPTKGQAADEGSKKGVIAVLAVVLAAVVLVIAVAGVLLASAACSSLNVSDEVPLLKTALPKERVMLWGDDGHELMIADEYGVLTVGRAR